LCKNNERNITVLIEGGATEGQEQNKQGSVYSKLD
jgi:hypothetical protein